MLVGSGRAEVPLMKALFDRRCRSLKIMQMLIGSWQDVIRHAMSRTVKQPTGVYARADWPHRPGPAGMFESMNLATQSGALRASKRRSGQSSNNLNDTNLNVRSMRLRVQIRATAAAIDRRRAPARGAMGPKFLYALGIHARHASSASLES